jgi:hypothetical protein
MEKNRSSKPFPETIFRFVIVVAGIIFLSGCTKFQYISVSSNLPQDDKKEFVIENDTVLIKYSFSGENLQVKATLYNKLQQPIYFDVQRSAVIINDYQISDAFLTDYQPSFIAPMAKVTVASNLLRDQFISTDTLALSKNKRNPETGIPSFSFNIATTPLFLRCVLAICPNGDYTYPTIFDYSFWVSDIDETVLGPSSVPNRPSNQFYIRHATGVGSTMSWVGLLGLVVVAAAIAPGE